MPTPIPPASAPRSWRELQRGRSFCRAARTQVSVISTGVRLSFARGFACVTTTWSPASISSCASRRMPLNSRAIVPRSNGGRLHYAIGGQARCSRRWSSTRFRSRSGATCRRGRRVRTQRRHGGRSRRFPETSPAQLSASAGLRGLHSRRPAGYESRRLPAPGRCARALPTMPRAASGECRTIRTTWRMPPHGQGVAAGPW